MQSHHAPATQYVSSSPSMQPRYAACELAVFVSAHSVFNSRHMQVTMWMAFVMMLCYLTVYSTVMVLHCMFRDTPKKSYDPKQPRKQAANSAAPSRQKTVVPKSQESDSGEISKPL